MTSASGGDLKQRVISAVLLIPLVLLAVWLGGSVFLLLVAVAVVLMAYEWSRVTGAASWRVDGLVQWLSVLSAIAALVMTNDFLIFSGIIAMGCAVAAVTGVALRSTSVWRILGIPYLALGCGAFVWLRVQQDIGPSLVIWLLAVIWAMDSGAYFAGRGIGGPKLAPRASPNKTWSGLIGGMLAAAAAGAVVAWFSSLGPAPALAATSALIGGWSQAGDIAESAVKRHFGVKDMSALIPGHGGILDRVDGLLFAAPAMVLAVLWLLPAWR